MTGPGAGAGGGHFTVMPDQIPQAIVMFERARDGMEALARRGRWEARVHPPGNDLVSEQVSVAMTSAGVEGPQSAVGAAESAAAEFDRIIDALRATAQTYGVAEDSTTVKFNA